MTRFDATTAADRQRLIVEAIAAHRERASPFCTFEVDPASAADVETLGVPWIQFVDGIVNLDCTEDELERCKSLIEEFPAFKIDELTRPEDAEGVNVRVSAKADANRIAQFVDRAFERVFDLPGEYRLWVVEL
ncbi:hypothetical protein [Halovivax sp.]|uniref:hypothetical protein n=1 Tax=Halovivax sp. TaxID=1935978 RepID=UPI0025C5BEA3|nr:hypothetical protein [Halovivax sp.]